jgi:hypothetical protein
MESEMKVTYRDEKTNRKIAEFVADSPEHKRFMEEQWLKETLERADARVKEKLEAVDGRLEKKARRFDKVAALAEHPSTPKHEAKAARAALRRIGKPNV